jgi:hypothetical protein
MAGPLTGALHYSRSSRRCSGPQPPFRDHGVGASAAWLAHSQAYYPLPMSCHCTAARWTLQPFVNLLSRFRECCTRWVWLVPYGCLQRLTTVQRTQMQGWLADAQPAACARHCWHSFLGAGGSSVGDSAVWLVPSLLCYSLLLLELCHGSVVGPSTPFLPGCWCFKYRELSCMAGSLTVVSVPLLVLCHGSVVRPSTPFLPGYWCF